jgi:hypothetical protein
LLPPNDTGAAVATSDTAGVLVFTSLPFQLPKPYDFFAGAELDVLFQLLPPNDAGLDDEDDGEDDSYEVGDEET